VDDVVAGKDIMVVERLSGLGRIEERNE